MCSIKEDIRESENLPHKAIHTKVLSPLTKVLNSLPVVVIITWTTPCDNVLCIHWAGWKLCSTAAVKIYDFEWSSGREGEMPASLLEMIRFILAEDI